MQQLMSRMRAAMEKYNMVNSGDKIAVGVSGGKDSLVLLNALAEMRRFYSAQYSVTAITADPCFFNRETDYTEIQRLCDKLQVEYIIKRTELYHIIFETRKETNPCSLCARMRRGILHDMAKDAGCVSLALGHHMDDAAETFMMNLLEGGTIGSFRPVTYLSRKDLYVIRPMIFASEKEVTAAANRQNLPVVKSPCPKDGNSERQNVKNLISELNNDYPHLKEKICGAMQKSEITGW